MPGSHSILSPSSSTRWLTCPGSVRMSAGLPDLPGAAAEEGTDAHELAALCLSLTCDAAEFVDKALPNGYIVDDEMAQGVQQYLDYIWGLEDGLLHCVEERVEIGHLTGEDDGHGTADCNSYGKDVLCVTDFKFGRVPVKIEGNTQLRTYAAGALSKLIMAGGKLPKKVRLSLVQPRFSKQPQVEEIPLKELSRWIDKVLVPGAAATWAPDAPLVPTEEGCVWCPARGNCASLAKVAIAVTGARDPVEIDEIFFPPNPDNLPNAAVGEIMAKAALVRLWLDAVEAEGLRRLQAGEVVLGQKLVWGRPGNRAWPEDTTELERVLKHEYKLAPETIFTLKLLSPANMMKLAAVKENPARAESFITRKEGAICAAPLSDKRPAYQPTLSADVVFADIK